MFAPVCWEENAIADCYDFLRLLQWGPGDIEVKLPAVFGTTGASPVSLV